MSWHPKPRPLQARISELGRESFGGRFSGRHRHDLELDEVGPGNDPALQQSNVIGLHDLEAAAKVSCDPAADESKAVGHLTALVAETSVNGLRVLVAEGFDDHEEHGWAPSG